MNKSILRDLILSLAIAFLICLCWQPLLVFFTAVVATPVPDAAAWLSGNRQFLLPEPAERYAYLSVLMLLSIVGGSLLLGKILWWNRVSQTNAVLLPLEWKPPWRTLLGIVILSAFIIALHLFPFPSRYLLNVGCEHHFGIVRYPFIMQDLATPQINQYGAYFLFLRPWFALFGTSITSLLSLFGILLLVSIAGLMYVTTAWCKDTRRILISSVLAILLVFPSTTCGSAYLQYHPLRTLFPMIALFLWFVALFASTSRIRHFARWTLSALAGLSIVWNVDSGLIVAVSSLFFLCLTAICKHELKWFAFEGLIMIVGFSFAYLLAASVFGKMDWLMEQLSFQKRFYLDGFFMLPMGNIFASGAAPILLVELMAFLYGCLQVGRQLRNPDSDQLKKGCYYLSAAVLALGLFSYYQGRSHDKVLHAVGWMPIFLFALLAHDMITALRKCHEAGSTSLSPVLKMVGQAFLVLMSAYFALFLCLALKYHAFSAGGILLMKLENKEIPLAEISQELGREAKVRDVTHVLVIGDKWQHEILRNIGLAPCPSQRCLTEIFLVEQEEQLIHALVSLKPNECAVLTRRIRDDYAQRYPQVSDFLAQCNKFDRGELILYIPLR